MILYSRYNISDKILSNDNIDLGEYHNIKITQKKITRNDVNLNDEITEYLKPYFYEKENNIVDEESEIDMNIDYYIKDKKNSETEHMQQYCIGNNELIDTHLIGRKKGDLITFTEKCPENMDIPELKGQTVTFKIKINSITKCVLPEITEAFVKDKLHFNSKKEFYDHLINSAIPVSQALEKERVKEELLDKVVEATTIREIPTEVYNQIYNEMKHSFSTYASLYNLEETEVLKSCGINETLEEHAQRKAKETIVVKSIAQRESLEPSDKRLNELREKYARDSGYDTLDAYIEDNGSDYLNRIILRDIVADYIYKNANVEMK